MDGAIVFMSVLNIITNAKNNNWAASAGWFVAALGFLKCVVNSPILKG